MRPVGVHRTCPIVIPEELDLSEIDRTLGGSIRSLPPERPVSGSRAASGLFSPFPSLSRLGPSYNRCLRFVSSWPSPSPCRRQVATAAHPCQCRRQAHHRASLARARPALSPPRPLKLSPLPSLTARLQSSCCSSSAVCPSFILVRPDQCSKIRFACEPRSTALF